jgi:hypothetical protein
MATLTGLAGADTHTPHVAYASALLTSLQFL